jgi:putative nucleotidyltransferase with HDIG domain
MQNSELRLRAKELLHSCSLPQDKIGHSLAVGECAENIAKRMLRAGLSVSADLSYSAGLLHDIGIAKSPIKSETEENENPWPEHAVEGARMAQVAGFPVAVVGAIQNHELLGFSVEEIKELKLAPAVIGTTWKYDTLEARTVAGGDQLVYIVRHMGYDPWMNRSSIVDANFDYFSNLYKKRTGQSITRNHPIFQRLSDEIDFVLNYAEPEDIPQAWEGISTVKPV